MDDNQTLFVEFFKKWYSANWKGDRVEFAKFLGMSYSHVSNILNGNKGCHETTRRKICSKLGVDYRTLLVPQSKPEATNNIHHFPIKKPPPDPTEIKHKSVHGLLDIVLNSGNDVLISAIEANLAAFSQTVEAQKDIKKLKKEQVEMLDMIKRMGGSG